MKSRTLDATEQLADGQPVRPVEPLLRVERVTLLLHHPGGARIVPLAPGEEVTVGRGEEATVTIDDRSLSRRHASFRLSRETGRVQVEDLGSTNGTRLRGELFTRAELTGDAEVELGGVIAAVRVLSLARDEGRELVGHESFRIALDDELRRARFFKRSFATLLARPRPGGERSLRRALPHIEEHLRPVDSVSFYSDEVLELLLPELGLDEAITLARALATDARLQLLVGVATYPTMGTSREELLDVTRSALQRATESAPVAVAARDDARIELREPRGAEGPVCESPAMKELYRSMAKVARSSIPVLLLAETGAGKEVLARFVHETSPRREAPLVCVNCAAIPESLLESTLFGHEKGAFTGATTQHAGVFESASRGTVFLDEIGELPLSAQAALLRVLEAKTIQRVGSTKELSVDVRIVAATHRDLAKMVEVGRFRQDLLYRLNTMTVTIPPLRHRREEIPSLASRFLSQANAGNGTKLEGISADAMSALLSHSWPGNVRELKNVIERAVVVAEGSVLGIDDLPTSLRVSVPADSGATADTVDPTPAGTVLEDFRTRMDRLEAQVLLDALRACDWNQTHAARRLGMPLRTLVHKLKVHNLKRLGYAEQPKRSP